MPDYDGKVVRCDSRRLSAGLRISHLLCGPRLVHRRSETVSAADPVKTSGTPAADRLVAARKSDGSLRQSATAACCRKSWELRWIRGYLRPSTVDAVSVPLWAAAFFAFADRKRSPRMLPRLHLCPKEFKKLDQLTHDAPSSRGSGSTGVIRYYLIADSAVTMRCGRRSRGAGRISQWRAEFSSAPRKLVATGCVASISRANTIARILCERKGCLAGIGELCCGIAKDFGCRSLVRSGLVFRQDKVQSFPVRAAT